MICIEEIFKYKVHDKDKLLKYGFEYSGGIFTKRILILRKQFILCVLVTDSGQVSYKVYEVDTGEEYILVHVANAVGGFVREVREACENKLRDISNKCFTIEVLKAEQTKRMVHFIENDLGVKPEFLWEKYPNDAVFRVADNEKWFAIIMTVDRSKVGLPGHGNIEIIVLKDKPENVEGRVDGKKFFKAYHMNKKHWYTICLNGTVPDTEVQRLIVASYELVAKK